MTTHTSDDFFDQNGNEMVVNSGGKITVNAGGAINAATGTINVNGVAVNPVTNRANTNITTVGAGTLTAAAIAGGVIMAVPPRFHRHHGYRSGYHRRSRQCDRWPVMAIDHQQHDRRV